MTLIIDRRQEPVRHTFGKDKARFLNRIRDAVHKAVQDKAADGPIKDIGKGGVKIPVPKALTQEPVIHHQRSPIFKKVFPGNLYDVGDIVEVPSGGGGGSGPGEGEGSPDADDDQDDFIWLSEKEFLNIFFDGRVLPDMVKLHSQANTITERQRSGYISKGPSHKLDMNVTNQKRRGEQIVFNKVAEKRMLKNFAEQYDIYRGYKPDFPEIELKGKKSKNDQLDTVETALKTMSGDIDPEENGGYDSKLLSAMFNCVSTIEEAVDPSVIAEPDMKRLEVLRTRLPEAVKTARDAKKFQSRHLTYKFDDEVQKPAAKAVMICKMDVSYSMTQEDKNTAKAFFFILNQFLEKNYDEVEMVFITHTTTAEEVDEEEFFYGQRTGGTIVSSCLEKEQEIIKERYNTAEWNIYSVQASDGDNPTPDNEKVATLMRENMPLQQASYFIEIRDPRWPISTLHQVYKNLADELPQLHTATISSPADAIEAFKSFFPVGGKAPANANQPAMG